MFRRMMMVTVLFMFAVLSTVGNAQQPTDPQNPSRRTQQGSSQTGQSTDRTRTDSTNSNRTQSDKNNMGRQDSKVSSSDREFVTKAAEGGKMEVAHAELALQKSSSDEVKRYAQRMIDDHTKANQELMSIASGKGLMASDMHSTHSQTSSNTTASSTSTTAGSSRSTTGSTGTTNPSSTASSSSTTNPSSTTGATNPNTESSGDMRRTDSGMKMSREHQQAMDRLSKLSGAEFDREYLKMDLKDHKKTIELFEKQARSGRDAELKAFAEKTLPTLREHHQMARDIAGKMGVSAEGTNR